MPESLFNTLSDDLVHVGATALERLEAQGYECEIEQRELGFPFVPACVARRDHEMLVVEVVSFIDKRRIERWIRYCKSQPSDSRVLLVVRQAGNVDQDDIHYLAERRVGLWTHNDEQLIEIRGAADLAVNVELPDLADLQPKVRKLLGRPFRKFDQEDWRDGLYDSYSQVEELSRDYLKDGISSGRIIIEKGRRNKRHEITVDEVESMSLGQLKDAFNIIQNQTRRDSLIRSTLEMINKTRVGLAHNRKKAETERLIRQNAGQHIYAVIACLEELLY